MLEMLTTAGLQIGGKQVLEIGTGWDPVAALYLAALGAEVTTTDLTRHVRTTDVVVQSVERALRPLLDAGKLQPKHAQGLRDCLDGAITVDGLLGAFGIRYLAPVADDVMLSMPPESFDLLFSIAVLEHVRPAHLEILLRGQKHVLRKSAFAYHDIGLGDHFTGVDASISFANFLQFEDGPVWRFLGENDIAYHNRYRHGDFSRLFAEHGFRAVNEHAQVDARSRELLESGALRAAGRFARYDLDDLATWRLAVVLQHASR